MLCVPFDAHYILKPNHTMIRLRYEASVLLEYLFATVCGQFYSNLILRNTSMLITDANDQLKKITTQKNADFSMAMKYFFDHFAEKESFLLECEPLTQKEDLKFFLLILGNIAKSKNATIFKKQLLLFRHKKYKLVHGTSNLSNHTSLVFYYYQDMQTGIATIPSFTGPSDYFRLTAFIQKAEDRHSSSVPIILPSTSDEIH